MASVSRREPRRGGAIKALAVVLGLLVVLFLYVAWQDALTPWDLPALLTSIPLWFYIAVLSVVAIFAASFAREGILASRSAAKASAARAARARPVGPAPEKTVPASRAPSPPREKRMVIDFVPVVKAVSKEVPPAVGAEPDDVPVVTASTKADPAVNKWPTETVPLGKPPRDRVAKAAPPVEPAPIDVTAAIPEPYLGPELESGPEPIASAPVESTPLTIASAPPDTLLGRLMSWLDETNPEAVTKRRNRRSSSKKVGR